MTEPDGQGNHRSLGRRAVLAQAFAAGAAILLVDPSADALVSGHLQDAEVDLEVTPNEPAFATGSIGGKPAVLRGSPLGGTVSGSILGSSFKAAVTQKDQVPQGSNFVTTTTIAGALGAVATDLVGTFTLGSDYLFESGVISGKTASELVTVSARRNRHFDTSSAVTVTGRFGGTPFSLVAVLPDGRSGTISGTVASRKVHFDFHPTGGNEQSVRLTGHYSGPIALLALILGAACYFSG